MILIAAGADFTCAVNYQKQMKCFGTAQGDVILETPSEFNEGVVAVAAGKGYACASSATLFQCWGSNEKGQSAVPTDLSSGATLIAARYEHTCARNISVFKCWGDST